MARTPERRPPWYRRFHRYPWVYLVLAFLVGLSAVVWASERATSGVRSNLDARLRDGGAGTDAALVALEAEQLSALRAILFTTGIAGDITGRHITALNNIVAPIQANSTVPMVDVLLPDGRVLLAVRAKGAPRPIANRHGMPGLKQAVLEARGRRGGRFTELVDFNSGPTVVTLGPVVSGKLPVAVVLSMTPLADALGRFSQEVGADLTAYDVHGRPIATTAPFTPASLDPDTAKGLVGGAAIVYRYVHAGDREALGRLVIDHQPVAVLGVTLPDDSAATGHAVGLYAGLGLLGTVLVLGVFWTRFAGRREEERR